MEKFLIRTAKRPKLDDSTRPDNLPPTVLITYNSDSIKRRIELGQVSALVKHMQSINADALLLQETRLKREDQHSCEQQLIRAGLKDFKFYWSSHPRKRYSGTALIVRESCEPLKVTYSLSNYISSTDQYPNHEKLDNPELEGRIVLAEYSTCFLLCVYTPNCSWYQPGRSRRDIWDKRFQSAILRLQEVKPVIIAGDLNVCHSDLDVSHPEFFESAVKPGNVGSADKGLPGQPGFTKFERDNFSELLNSCNLVDTFRELHKDSQRVTWGYGASWSIGTYKDKFMGLDYVLLSRRLWDKKVVVRSEIGGAETCFGSDHCYAVAEFDWSKLTAPGADAAENTEREIRDNAKDKKVDVV